MLVSFSFLGFSQEVVKLDSNKHEIGIKMSLFRLNTQTPNNSIIYYDAYERLVDDAEATLPFIIYKYHFGNFAFRTGTSFYFKEKNSSDNSNEDLSVFRLSSGIQYNKIFNKISLLYAFDFGYNYFNTSEYGQKTTENNFNVSPLIFGGYYFLTNHLSFSTELDFKMQFSKIKQGSVSSNYFNIIPNLTFSINIHL